MRALALEHWHSDAFSVFGELLAERQVSVDRVLVSDVDHMPDWREYDLIIAMGGPMGVYEEVEYPWLVGEKRTIREAVKAYSVLRRLFWRTATRVFAGRRGLPRPSSRARLESDLPDGSRPP